MTGLANTWDNTVATTFDVLRTVGEGRLTEAEVKAGPGPMTPIDGELAQAWLDRVIQSQVLPPLGVWRRRNRERAGKRNGGPAPAINDAVILTIALILVIEHSSVRVQDMARALQHRLTPEAREVLGVGHLYDNPFTNWYFIAHRAIHRVIATFDPYITNDGAERNQWKALSYEDRIAWKAAVDQEFVAELNARAEWFMHALVEMSLQQQARKYRRRKTAMTIDQSGVKAGAVMARWKRDPKTGKEIPQKNALDPTTNEPEARRVRAMEADWVTKKKGAKKRNADEEERISRFKWELGYMANIIIDVLEDPNADKKLYAPQLIRAISLGTPNKRIGGHAISLLDSLQARGYELTRLSFDRGYSQLKDEFHEQLVQRGIPVVKDYVDRQKGITNGAIGNSIMVEGRYYCPSTPIDLLESTKNWEQGKLTNEEYWAKRKKLEKYELILHEQKTNGTLRLSCPASGPSPTASCPLRELMKGAVPDEEADRVHIYEENITDRQKDYKVCCQKSVSVKPTTHVQQRQKLRYGSKEWFDTYRADRNSSESSNDLLQKDHNLENTMARPMHGLAAQQFALALFAVASNMRRIIQYEHDVYELERRAAAGRAPQPRKQPGEYLERARDRNRETRYMRNPPPRKLVPWEPLELPPVPA
ncbi:hypothetical protein AAEP80_04030 [Curtobacterium sp. L3-7]|uniref:hypothetical protein n=1 Tax=Curtobacterium sp. L3-7 TaxID=3138787 RepID=UPI003B51DFEC